jgi:hypothetical protein
VFARRVVDESDAASAATAATYTLAGEANGQALALRAKSRGTWGNRLQIRVEDAEAKDLVADELVRRVNGSMSVSAGAVVDASVGSISVTDAGLTQKYPLRAGAASAQSAQLNPVNRAVTFATMPSGSAEIRASYWVPATSLRKVTLRFGNAQEVYVVPSLSYLAQQLRDQPSRLAEVVSGPTTDGMPRRLERFEPFAGGGNGAVGPGHFQEGLESLVEQDVQLLVVAGREFKDVKASVLGHLEKTENLGRERIAVIGADASDVDKITENANDVADKRFVLVAPGLRQLDLDTGQTLSLRPSYAAAAVAGRLAGLAPHVSLTNKTLAGIDVLAAEYNYGELKTLVQSRVLTLQRKRGTRVVKAITTDDEAFKQITLRRIVDYVKQGTRQGANQYIGKLNNRRVRENLRTTLDGFLADLVAREFLTGYKLTVFADRAMEIRGEVQVVMDLNPTFSIDVIRVVMNLS